MPGDRVYRSLPRATVAKKKLQLPPTLCTFCGKPATPVTWDDPFPRALWVGTSTERPLKVQSCGPCNNRSYEAILKHFFIVLDSRFYPDTIKHFRTPQGKGDLRTFLSMWKEFGENCYLYLDEKITAKFVKMFMGVRRHLLKKAWFFLPQEQFILFKADKLEDHYEARQLPLTVGGPNPAGPLSQEWTETLDHPMQYKLRDFSYELFANDADGMMMGIRYEREEFAGLGNRLYLLCFVHTPRPDTASCVETEA
jgi:hypothetical protein